MTTYFLEAEDVLFFRDGRPFNAGEEHHAASRFPPAPSVIQGVFRSHYLLQQGIPLDDRTRIRQAVGDGEDFKGLRLSAPLLARWEKDGRLTRFFPTPADAGVVKGDAEKDLIQPRRLIETAFTSLADSGLKYLLAAPPENEPEKGDVGAFLNEADFADYFFSAKPVKTAHHSELFEREARLGIQLEGGSRSTKDGMLYEAEFIRPCEGVGLLVEMDGLPGFPPSGVMRAGGEGRALRYRAVQPPSFTVKVGQAGQVLPETFKVYWVSPGWFEGGWKPQDWSMFFDGKVEVVAAAVAGYEVIGGYDLFEGKQKPASRWLPAGSVIYFRSEGGAVLKQAALTERGAPIGYGQIVIGEWKPG